MWFTVYNVIGMYHLEILMLAQACATYSILSLIIACIGRDSVAVFSGPG